MGFFSKIFGGGKKSDPQENKAVSGEQQAIADEKSQSLSTASTPAPEEEDRVPEPELKDEDAASAAKSEHKPTVFGMPAPPFAAGSVPVVSGEAVVGEIAVDAAAEKPLQEAAGEMVVGETAGVSSGSVEAGEVVIKDAAVETALGASEPAAGPAAAESASEPPEEPKNAETEEAVEMVEAEVAAPPPLPAVEPEARSTSGSRPAIVDEPADADLELFPKAEKRDLRSSIECTSCKHRLPVPYVGYPARITCPFCLNVNEYNLQ